MLFSADDEYTPDNTCWKSNPVSQGSTCGPTATGKRGWTAPNFSFLSQNHVVGKRMDACASLVSDLFVYDRELAVSSAGSCTVVDQPRQPRCE
jgi:hypothetical protein